MENIVATLGEITLAVFIPNEKGTFNVIVSSAHFGTPFHNYDKEQAMELVKQFVPIPCRSFIKFETDKFISDKFFERKRSNMKNIITYTIQQNKDTFQLSWVDNEKGYGGHTAQPFSLEKLLEHLKEKAIRNKEEERF